MNRLVALSAICAFLSVPVGVYAANEDLRPDITEREYSQEVRNREAYLRQLEADVSSARAALNRTLALLANAQARYEDATALFAEAEKNPGNSAKLADAWRAVASAYATQEGLTQTRTRQQGELLEAEQKVTRNRIWLEKYKNDYEAQSAPFAVRDAIARCASRFCSASSFLAGERMAVFQPHVLEMIGAHHAYARGLTGKGIRIAIDDDIVSYRLPEFEGRISFEGAELLYPLLPNDDRYADAKACDQAAEDEGRCHVFSYNNPGNDALFRTLAVRWIVALNGWPGEEQTWYLRNNAYEEGEGNRWAIVPHGGRGRNADGEVLSHGTQVASVAAGRDFGVAPGATIVPLAKDYSWQGWDADRRRNQSLLREIRGMSAVERTRLDARWAEEIYKHLYALRHHQSKLRDKRI